jgi:hypothetical protein
MSLRGNTRVRPRCSYDGALVDKLRITALEGAHQAEVFEAQFNPKEIEVDRTFPWWFTDSFRLLRSILEPSRRE